MGNSRSLIVVVIVALVALCAFFSRSAQRHSNGAWNVATYVEPSATPAGADDDVDSPGREAGEIDLFGNAVTEAVAQYRLDATGSLYEVHSPQTEIPKLASPKS